MVVIRGRVIKGKGGYGKVSHGPETASFFKNVPVKGTLNIALDQPVRLRHAKALVPMFWPSYIEGIPCLITRTSHTPLHIVEAISDEQLPCMRGDHVTLVIPRGYTLDLPSIHHMTWKIFYGFGRTHWYQYKIYRRLLGPFYFVRRLAIQDPERKAR